METHLFKELILSEGATLVSHFSDKGIITERYQGINHRIVIIQTTDEYITQQTCRDYLIQLGLSDVVMRIF